MSPFSFSESYPLVTDYLQVTVLPEKTPMAKAGITILIAGAAAVMTAVFIGAYSDTALFAPWRSYTCDFRLISHPTCALPLVPNLTRSSVPAAEVDRAKRLDRRERIIACEQMKTTLRLRGEPVPGAKCWDESSR